MEIATELMCGLVHDFNNLLVMIKANCDLLLENDLPQHVATSVQRMRKAASQGSRFSDKLLALARGESPKKDVINIDSALREMDALLRFALRPNLELDLQLSALTAQTPINHICLQQVVLNLVLNARDALRDGGVIAVRTRTVSRSDQSAIPSSLPPGNYIALEVSDNGRQMGAAASIHGFEPFLTTEGSPGKGLGLTIVHRIVALNGGEVQMASAAEKGSTVRVLLPDISQDADTAVGIEGRVGPDLKNTEKHIPFLWSPNCLIPILGSVMVLRWSVAR